MALLQYCKQALVMVLILTTTSLSLGVFNPLSLFEVNSAELSGKTLSLMIADNDQKRARGMMFIESWPKGVDGMLFIFKKEDKRSFWMRNTLLPLSLGFFNKKGELIEMAKMNPAKSLAQVNVDSVQTQKKAKLVLEVPQGWFEKNKIKIGAKLKLL